MIDGLAGLARRGRRDRGQQRGLRPELTQVIEGLALRTPPRLSDSNGVILAVKELRLMPQRVLKCQKTFV